MSRVVTEWGTAQSVDVARLGDAYVRPCSGEPAARRRAARTGDVVVQRTVRLGDWT